MINLFNSNLHGNINKHINLAVFKNSYGSRKCFNKSSSSIQQKLVQRILKYSPIGDDQEKDVFETTVQMSTYLVAFVVCDFKKISNTTSNGTAVSIVVNFFVFLLFIGSKRM